MSKKLQKSSKAKKFKKSTARKKLHAMWSESVRQRDGYACQWCLQDGRRNVSLKHHAHHIVPRSVSGTTGAFDVDNGITLCYPCHLFRLKSYIDEYIEFRNKWLAENIYIDYITLRDRLKPITKFTEEFYEQRRLSLVKIRGGK